MPFIDKRRIEGIRVPGHGPKPCKLMVVGERPGKQEPLTGIPFTGAAGKELDRYLALSRTPRSSVYVTNVVKDYLDADPTDDEIARDAPELEQEIEDCQPELIVPVGRFAIRYFLGDVDVEQVHGLLHFNEHYGAVYPCYHPAAGLHSPDSIQFIQDDFKGLGVLEQRFLPEDRWPIPEYPANQPPSWYADLPIDTEGFPHAPWCLTYSQIAGKAGLIMAGDERLRWIQEYISRSECNIILHNSMHDLGVLRALGCPIPTGRFRDTMVMAYNLCLLPQGLKPLAYRIAGMEMSSYEEVIAPGREMVWAEWMEAAQAIADTFPKPEEQLVWEGKINAFRLKQPQTIAQRIKRMFTDVGKKGFLMPDNPDGVDISKRLASWDDNAASDLRDIHPLPEPTLSDIPRQHAADYACRDADATNRIEEHLWGMIKAEGLEQICMIDHGIIPMVDRMQSNGLPVSLEYMADLDQRLTADLEGCKDKIEALVGVRINPSSSPQVAALLFKQLKLTSRKTTKEGNDSTNDKVLMALRNEHPVLPLIMEYRGIDKARGSFVRSSLRKAGKDHRLRCTLRVTRVSSGRLAASDPNLMAFPVRDALGKEIRQGFVAPEGHILADWDLDQAEMRFMAHESQDEGLIDVFRSGSIDVHRDTASRMFGIPYDAVDPNLHRYPAKRVGFGVITGITGLGLVDQMALAGVNSPDGDEYTESECDNFIDLWFKARPQVKVYMDRCRAEARRFGRVADYFGRIRYLPGVWSTLERIREEACRQSHSHKIQAGAQGYIKVAMAQIWWYLENVWWPRGGRWADIEPLLQIHDSLLFELPDDPDIWTEVDETIRMCLSQAVELLVPMGAKGGWALNWGDLK